jgi:2-polyprenyl-3-methyl-5-hydroxy-6-metoxy-1,4-benzoquinol methylase
MPISIATSTQDTGGGALAEQAILILILRHPVSSSGLRILDVGCGDGLFFGKLAEFGDVDGVEPSEGLLNPQGPFRERIQSFVLMFDVLEHLNNPGEALRHAHLLLTPGGALLLTVPASEILWTNHDTINQYLVCYRRGALCPLLGRRVLRFLKNDTGISGRVRSSWRFV